MAKKALPIPLQRFLYQLVRGGRIRLVTEPERDLQAIFIHVPKNAGVSISKGLFETRVGHRRFQDLQFHEPELVQEYFVFSFVRNPWDRFLSTYKFLRQGGFNKVDEEWAEEHLSTWDRFEDFVLALKDSEYSELVLAEKHFRPQAYWLLDHRGEPSLDYIGRYESLDDDFVHVCARLGTHCSLPHLNRSDHKPYHHYYGKRTRQIVGNLYRQDIELFNYSFAVDEGT